MHTLKRIMEAHTFWINFSVFMIFETSFVASLSATEKSWWTLGLNLCFAIIWLGILWSSIKSYAKREVEKTVNQLALRSRKGEQSRPAKKVKK